MAIAHDATSSSAASSADPVTWTHTPTGTPRGIVVLVVENGVTVDNVVGATYGGVAMTEVTGSPLIHSTGAEDATIHGFFLGASVPTGAQTVSVDFTATAGTASRRGVAFSVTAAADTAVEGTNTLDSGGVANPSVTVSTGASVETMVYGVCQSGIQSPVDIMAGSGCTEVLEHDYGNQVASWIRSTSVDAGGGFTMGWTAASEEAGILAVAVKESAGGAPPEDPFPFVGGGFYPAEG